MQLQETSRPVGLIRLKKRDLSPVVDLFLSGRCGRPLRASEFVFNLKTACSAAPEVAGQLIPTRNVSFGSNASVSCVRGMSTLRLCCKTLSFLSAVVGLEFGVSAYPAFPLRALRHRGVGRFG